jgi:hypothetical protein
VASYGNFLSSASVTANRDITDIWAAGDINGSFTATRNIGDIFSYGSINASFTATGTTGDSDTGQIGSTTAVGSIAGSFSAGTSIGDLIAGSAITASRTAPTLGNLFPYDSNVASQTAPAGPASATAAVLAALALAQADVTNAVNDYFTSATQALSDANTALSNAQTDATAALATAMGDLTSRNTQLRTDATDADNQTANATNDAYNNARNQAFAAWNTTIAAALDMANNANNANANAVTGSVNAVANLDNQFANLDNVMAQADGNMTNQSNQAAVQNAAQIADHPANWNDAWLQQSQQQILAGIGQPAPAAVATTSSPAWYNPWTYWDDWSWRGLGRNYVEGAQILFFAESEEVDQRWGGLRLWLRVTAYIGVAAGTAAGALLAVESAAANGFYTLSGHILREYVSASLRSFPGYRAYIRPGTIRSAIELGKRIANPEEVTRAVPAIINFLTTAGYEIPGAIGTTGGIFVVIRNIWTNKIITVFFES